MADILFYGFWIIYFWVGLYLAFTHEYDQEKSQGERVLVGWARLLFWPMIPLYHKLKEKYAEAISNSTGNVAS